MTKIPYDITYYVRRQLIKKIVWVAVLTAALAVFFAFFGAAIFGERCPLWLVAIFSALITLLPFLLLAELVMRCADIRDTAILQ